MLTIQRKYWDDREGGTVSMGEGEEGIKIKRESGREEKRREK